MWYRMQIASLFVAPVVVIGALYLLGLTIAVPTITRDHVIRIELPEAGTPVELPAIAGPADAARPLVVIDPGHGGHDPGASGAGHTEKFLVAGPRARTAPAAGGGWRHPCRHDARGRSLPRAGGTL